MKKFILALCLLCLSLPVFAENVTYPPNARYVIVNPNGRLKASSTFLLDTKTGKVWQLVVDSNNDNAWQQMEYDWYKQDGTWGGHTRKSPIQIAP